MKTIGIIARPDLAPAEAANVLGGLVAFLRGRGCGVIIEGHVAALAPGITADGVTVAGAAQIGTAADALVVLGGDGTLLAASHLIEREDVPLIGVNFGSLGFLTEITPPELHTVLERVLTGDYPYAERRLLRAVLRRAGEDDAAGQICGDVLNDVVVTKAGALSRIIEMEVRVDGAFVSSFRADGLIVASPTGSTAYNLAVGGPILHPSLAAIVVTAISPHALSSRPLVLADEAAVAVCLRTRGVEVHLTLDGQRGLALCPDDTVTITRSPRRLRLALSPARDYYDILRTKLRWGESRARQR
jgi:NAD+ kinase